MNKIDRQNFVDFYRDNYTQLVNYAYYRLSDINMAEELVQEAFLKTWTYNNNADDKILDYKNYIYRVLKNLIIDTYKQNHKNTIPLEVVTNKLTSKAINLEEVIDNRMHYNLIIQSIHKLEKRYKDILLYRFVEELTIDTISTKTGLSPNYVSVITYKGLKIVRKQVEKFIES